VTEESLTLRRPDDWHVHLRDGAMLAAMLPFTAQRFARAIIMPNLLPPITTVSAARAYRSRILEALPKDARFAPLMTCYLTDDADPAEIERGYREGVFAAVKLYPASATTNSAHGITDIQKAYPVLERMARLGIPLLIHGEATDREIDVFDREAAFLSRTLAPLMERFPALKIVLEHITTKEAVEFVSTAGPRLTATITAHHLIINRNAIFAGGLRPHMYCLPIAKREPHRLALRRAATSGNAKFFLGTDTAPHPAKDKESDCGCAGIFTAPAALELYAQVFAEEHALDRLEAFASLNGPRFYGLPVNEDRITLVRRNWRIPTEIRPGGEMVRPFLGGEEIGWQIER